MKKLSIALLLAATCGISAQSVKYGLTGNVHITGINSIYDASKPKFGGGFGVLATIPLYPSDAFKSQYMFIQPQVEFSMQGENSKVPGYGDQKFNNNYISAAVYYKYFFHKEGVRSDVYLFAGPKAEFLVSNSRETTAAYEIAHANINKDKNINNFGVGVSGGVGYSASDEIEIFARYDQGLTKVYPDNPNNTFNGVIALGLNYIFKGKAMNAAE